MLLVFCQQSFSDSCSASPNNCAVSCTAIAPAGGTVDCYKDSLTAECSTFDDDGMVSNEKVQCDSGGTGGGGSGGGPQYCSLYWWICSPWAL